MTTLLHPLPGDDCANKLRTPGLEQLATATAAATQLPARYVGPATTAGVLATVAA